MSGVRMGTLALALFASGAAWAGGGVTFRAGRTEVVVPKPVPRAMQVSVTELTNFLSQVLGAPVPAVTAPTPGRSAIVLGEKDARTEPRDSFVLRTAGGDRLYICGDDVPDEKCPTDRGSWVYIFHRRSTLWGVYEFLERYCGVRFYFPGELGTVVPRRDEIRVPEIDRLFAPHSIERRYYSMSMHGKTPELPEKTLGVSESEYRRLSLQRQRVETIYIPCCHGQGYNDYLGRFGREHPEYFVMKADGTRRVETGVQHAGHLCHTSKVWDEILRDSEAYLRGESPETRGFGRYWPTSFREGNIIDLMVEDGYVPCHCDVCAKAFGKGTGRTFADFVWERTAETARRLTADGFDAYVTQNAYGSMSEVPQTDIPTNVLVMVAVRGPWDRRGTAGWSVQFDRMRAWNRKLGRKVWLWTYPHKYGSLEMPDVPHIAPRAIGAYHKEAARYTFGAFAEAEADRHLFSHLNFHVMMKVLWDPTVDVDALLGEYYRLMYGPAAGDIRRLFEEIEDKWIGEVVSSSVDTPVGPVARAPSLDKVYGEIYGKATLLRWKGYLDRAARRVRPGSLEARRVRLVRTEIVGPLARRVKQFLLDADFTKPLEKAGDELVSLGSFGAEAKVENGREIVRADGRREVGTRWFITAEKVGGSWLDTREFVSAPSSLAMAATPDRPVAEAMQYLDLRDGLLPPLEPMTRYRLDFCMKTEDIVPVERRGGVGVTVMEGRQRVFPEGTTVVGTNPWRRYVFEFETGPAVGEIETPYIYLKIFRATGKVWFDEVHLQKMGPAKAVNGVSGFDVRREGDGWVLTGTLAPEFRKSSAQKPCFMLPGLNGEKKRRMVSPDAVTGDGRFTLKVPVADCPPGSRVSARTHVGELITGCRTMRIPEAAK